MEENLKSLGQTGSSYAVFSDKFDPSFLERIPRTNSRSDYGITGSEFSGYDVWHCREASVLTNSGLPVTGILKVIYPANSDYIVESKSFKLYLNSFTMCKMGYRMEDTIDNYECQVEDDLEALLQTRVVAKFFDLNTVEIDITNRVYNDLYSVVDVEQLEFTDYNTEKNHLQFDKDDQITQQDTFVYTNSLRSRCRHTKQADSGTVFIRIQTENGVVNLESLLKKIVSFRDKADFHEPLAEKLFVDIMKLKGVTGCGVMLLYNRRGSLDINPIRMSHPDLLEQNLVNINLLTRKTLSQ